MINSGFNGTGTAFVLYILLAILMPFVQIYRIIKRNKKYAHHFIAKHVAMAITLVALALLCIGYAWHHIARSTTGSVHGFLLITAYVAIAMLGAWIIIPHLIVAFHKATGRTHLLKPSSPLIHPWVDND